MTAVNSDEITIGSLTERRAPIGAGVSSSEVDVLFERDPDLASVLVRRDGFVHVVNRTAFYQTLTGRLGFGWTLYHQRPIALLLGEPARTWAADTPVTTVGMYLLEAANGSADDDLVVRWADGDVGTVPVRTILKWISGAFAAQMKELDLLAEQLRHRAFHDSLTGLANRALFADRVEHALGTRRPLNEHVAVLYCDLDDFKAVNDALGHATGDALLVEVAKRLDATVRLGDTVARLGGDEFAILVERVTDPLATYELASRLESAVREPLVLDGMSIVTTMSIGVATTEDADDGQALVRNADAAMYAAKRAGKGGHHAFEPVMHGAALERLQLRNDLRGAVERDEFVLYYQPVVDLVSASIVGVEALVRWNHPKRGLLGPAEFIPIAEETGTIIELGRWVLEQACLDVQSDLFTGDGPLSLSVNLSVSQISDRLIDEVRGTLDRSGLAPRQLTLEVTESLFVRDMEHAVGCLQALRDLGARIAIDDFGTGYSSLARLQTLPVDTIKIDRSFVSGLGGMDPDATVIAAILELASVREVLAVAEGIENTDQAERLRALNCELGQGFLFAKPMDREALGAVLRADRAAGVSSAATRQTALA